MPRAARKVSAPAGSNSLCNTHPSQQVKRFFATRVSCYVPIASILLALTFLLSPLVSEALLPSDAFAMTQSEPASDVAQIDTEAEAQLVSLINQARTERGLQPLTVDPRLTQAARKHSQLMVEHRALSHQFPGEPALQQRFANEGLPSDREGENVDLDQDADSAHDELMHSPPHKRNILDPDYNVVGVGVIRKGENIYTTEDFARRLPEVSEHQAESEVQAAINRYESARGLPAPVRKAQPELGKLACDMALNDSLDDLTASQLPGVHSVFAWTAGDPAKLPTATAKLLASGLPSGYALGACFAPSVSHPGGVYWLVMVSY